jgi:drug/metabolite transporter (DMT)-like permease
MKPTPPNSSQRLAARIAAVVIGLAGMLYLAWAGFHTRHPELGVGALVVGMVVLAFFTVSLITGRRGPLPVRVAGGQADERERRIVEHALARSAVAMLVACGFGVVLGLDANGPFIAAAIAVTGLVTLGISAFIQSRRAR